MDCQQDLAVNTLTILETEGDDTLKCMGNAEFKKSVKIYNTIHVQNDIRTCGNIIPLDDTATLGNNQHLWMDINAVDGTFNKINVDVLNVKKINCSSFNDNHNHNHEYIKIITNISLINLTNKYELSIIDLSEKILPIMITGCENIDLKIKFINYKNKNIIIINPNKLLISIDNDDVIPFENIRFRDSYQIYNFVYINEIKKNILTYKY